MLAGVKPKHYVKLIAKYHIRVIIKLELGTPFLAVVKMMNCARNICRYNASIWLKAKA